jgi:2',3'-cyclic-nucleotide 2'-phosphodiesterase (5'-nucleotidase family)
MTWRSETYKRTDSKPDPNMKAAIEQAVERHRASMNAVVKAARELAMELKEKSNR